MTREGEFQPTLLVHTATSSAGTAHQTCDEMALLLLGLAGWLAGWLAGSSCGGHSGLGISSKFLVSIFSHSASIPGRCTWQRRSLAASNSVRDVCSRPTGYGVAVPCPMPTSSQPTAWSFNMCKRCSNLHELTVAVVYRPIGLGRAPNDAPSHKDALQSTKSHMAVKGQGHICKKRNFSTGYQIKSLFTV